MKISENPKYKFVMQMMAISDSPRMRELNSASELLLKPYKQKGYSGTLKFVNNYLLVEKTLRKT